MEQTPLDLKQNSTLLEMIPLDAARIVEVGSNSGALAKNYRALNPQCRYTGIEIEPSYAEQSRHFCSDVIVGNVETLSNEVFAGLFPSDGWVFGDVLEHLYDPWELLRRLRAQSPAPQIFACIPNAQHWSLQGRLNSGKFRYESAGLLDRTHIRFFTRLTMIELFQSSGYRIDEGIPLYVPDAFPEGIASAIRAMASASGNDPEMAVKDATPYEWVVKAIPI